MSVNWQLALFRYRNVEDEHSVAVKSDILSSSGRKSVHYVDAGDLSYALVIVQPSVFEPTEIIEIANIAASLGKRLVIAAHSRHSKQLRSLLLQHRPAITSMNIDFGQANLSEQILKEYVVESATTAVSLENIIFQEIFEISDVAPKRQKTGKKDTNVTKKIVVVSVETDDLVAGCFDYNPSELQPLALVNGSIVEKAETAKIGDEGNYKARLTSFIDNYILNHEITTADIASIVIVHPGEIDSNKGIVVDAGRFELQNLNLQELLQDAHNVPNIHVFHDGPSLTSGELEQGIGNKHQVQSAFFCIVSSGVGGAIYIRGEHHQGATMTAGDIGHTIVNLEGSRCLVCKRRGCLETYTSRYWINDDILRRYEEAIDVGYTPKKSTRLTKLLPNITDPWTISTNQLAQAVKDEDEFALAAIESASTALGYGLAIIVDFLNPELIILGGDLMDKVDLYFNKALQHGRRIAYKEAWDNTHIERAQLGRVAALWGGANQSIKLL